MDHYGHVMSAIEDLFGDPLCQAICHPLLL